MSHYQAPGPVRQYGYTIKASQLVVLCYDNPSKPMQLRNRMISCYMWTLRHRKVKCLSKVTQITRGRQFIPEFVSLVTLEGGVCPLPGSETQLPGISSQPFLGVCFLLDSKQGHNCQDTCSTTGWQTYVGWAMASLGRDHGLSRSSSASFSLQQDHDCLM